MNNESSEPNPSMQIDRRKFIRASGAALAGTAAGVLGTRKLVNSALPKLRQEYQATHDCLIEKPIQIGTNLSLHPITVRHDVEAWKKYGPKITELVNSYPIVIPEYFPPEYTHLENDPDRTVAYLVGAIKRSGANYLFEGVEQAMKTGKNDVWVLDPAYNKEFITLRETLMTVDAAGVLIATKAIDKLTKTGNSKKREEGITRRTFLRTAAAGAIAYGTSSIAGFSSETDPAITPEEAFWACGRVTVDCVHAIENDLRRVVVAEALTNLSKRFEKPSQALLIYTKPHWERIIKYIDNPQERKLRLKVYSSIPEIRALHSLFIARNYQTDGESWSKIAEMPSV